MDKLEVIKKKCGKYEFVDYPKMIGLIVAMAQNEYSETQTRQRDVDMELSDLLHYLESEKLPAHKMAKVCSEIKKRRIERRETNAKISYLSRFINALDTDKCKFAIGQLQMDSLCIYKDCDYKPRILDIDKDLFGGGN